MYVEEAEAAAAAATARVEEAVRRNNIGGRSRRCGRPG